MVIDYDIYGKQSKSLYLTPFLDENLLTERCGKRYWFTQDGLG